MFWFPSAYKSYVYTLLPPIKTTIALCLKKKKKNIMHVP